MEKKRTNRRKGTVKSRMHLERRKTISSRKYWKQTPSNKRQWIKTSSSSSSSCHALSKDIPDPLSPPLRIVHCFRLVFRAISRIYTELLYVGSSWSSCLCSAMWRGPQEYITYELVPTSPAVSRMFGGSNFDSFVMGGWWPYSCCFVGCYLRDFFNIARSILV